MKIILHSFITLPWFLQSFYLFMPPLQPCIMHDYLCVEIWFAPSFPSFLPLSTLLPSLPPFHSWELFPQHVLCSRQCFWCWGSSGEEMESLTLSSVRGEEGKKELLPPRGLSAGTEAWGSWELWEYIWAPSELLMVVGWIWGRLLEWEKVLKHK